MARVGSISPNEHRTGIGAHRIKGTSGLTLIAAAVVALATACSSSTGDPANKQSSGKSSQSSDSAAAQSNCVKSAQAIVKTGTTLLGPTVPTVPFDMSKAKGKVIWDIEPALTYGSVKAIMPALKEAAAAAGVHLRIFDGSNQVTVWNQGVSQAVSQNAAGIILNSIDPKLVSGPLAQAKAKGIPVISANVYQPSANIDGNLYAAVTTPNSTQGEWAAAEALVRSNCSGTIGIFTDTAFASIAAAANGAEALIKSLCPQCKTVVKNLPPAETVSGAAPATTALLNGENNLTAIIGPDAILINAIPVVQAAHRTEVSMIGTLSDPENFPYIRSGVESSDIGVSPWAYEAWLDIDLLGRAMTGAAPVKAEMGLQIITKDNMPPAPAGDLTSQFAGFQDQFKHVWGVN